MSDDYFIVPATVTKTDTGKVVKRTRAVLHVNDGSEDAYDYATTADAKEEAAILFGVVAWREDDLGTLWPL